VKEIIYKYSYEILEIIIMKRFPILHCFITFNTLICKLETLYWMGKPIYGHFTHILHEAINSFHYIFHNIVDRLYTKFGKKKKILKLKNWLQNFFKNPFFLPTHSTAGVHYREHSITWIKYHNIFSPPFVSYALNNVMPWWKWK